MAGSSGSSRCIKKEPSRRVWTAEEEKALLEELKVLVAKGWKSDNGFRGGYLRHLEGALNTQFPFCNLKAEPHIHSKLTTWKKTYASIMGVLNRSGVGFNVHGDNKIDCDEEGWAEIIRVDSQAQSFRDKAWPLLEGWKKVFGKDRATGEAARDVMESVNEMHADHTVLGRAAKGKQPENFIDLEDNLEPQTGGDSVCQSTHVESKTTSSSKKRKAKDPINNLCELLSSIHKDTNTRLQDLVQALRYHADLGKLRQEVWPLLQNMDDLSLDDKLCVCEKLVLKTERLQMFMSLPEMAKVAFVHRLLSTVD